MAPHTYPKRNQTWRGWLITLVALNADKLHMLHRVTSRLLAVQAFYLCGSEDVVHWDEDGRVVTILEL